MKRTQKSQKRTKFLFILIVLTAILSITATYAWFSTQRTVEIVGMRLNVEVAESMQISLDGEKWAQSISIADMRQFYGTYTGTSTEYAIYQAKPVAVEGNGNTNYVPTELLPVSSAGEVSAGKLQFVQGTLTTAATGTMSLSGITACSESDLVETATVATREKDTANSTGNANHPYLVFDMYLRNISARTDGTDDPLILNTGSRVWIDTTTQEEGVGVEGTGLEYSSRVGFVIYDNTVDINAADTADKTLGQQIRGIAASTENKDVAVIWEPNHYDHTNYVVTNNSRISSISQAVTTYAVKAATTSVTDINSTTDSGLLAPQTMTPDYSLETGTTATASMTDVNGNSAGIAPNKISRVRVYVWLEGQDPDCIDMASTGDKLNITIKLDRNANTNSDGNSYKDPYTPGT